MALLSSRDTPKDVRKCLQRLLSLHLVLIDIIGHLVVDIAHLDRLRASSKGCRVACPMVEEGWP
jgi:hypothetical protein